jgi:hypothetical protein
MHSDLVQLSPRKNIFRRGIVLEAPQKDSLGVIPVFYSWLIVSLDVMHCSHSYVDTTTVELQPLYDVIVKWRGAVSNHMVQYVSRSIDSAFTLENSTTKTELSPQMTLQGLCLLSRQNEVSELVRLD